MATVRNRIRIPFRLARRRRVRVYAGLLLTQDFFAGYAVARLDREWKGWQ